MKNGGFSIRKIPIGQVRLDRRELLAVQKVLQSGYLRQGRVTPDFPVSTRLAMTVPSLPVHPGLSNYDVGRIVQAVRAVAGS